MYRFFRLTFMALGLAFGGVAAMAQSGSQPAMLLCFGHQSSAIAVVAEQTNHGDADASFLLDDEYLDQTADSRTSGLLSFRVRFFQNVLPYKISGTSEEMAAHLLSDDIPKEAFHENLTERTHIAFRAFRWGWGWNAQLGIYEAGFNYKPQNKNEESYFDETQRVDEQIICEPAFLKVAG